MITIVYYHNKNRECMQQVLLFTYMQQSAPLPKKKEYKSNRKKKKKGNAGNDKEITWKGKKIAQKAQKSPSTVPSYSYLPLCLNRGMHHFFVFTWQQKLPDQLTLTWNENSVVSQLLYTEAKYMVQWLMNYSKWHFALVWWWKGRVFWMSLNIKSRKSVQDSYNHKKAKTKVD